MNIVNRQYRLIKHLANIKKAEKTSSYRENPKYYFAGRRRTFSEFFGENRKTTDKIGRWMIIAKGTRVEDTEPVTTISSLRDQRGVAKREQNIADERKFTTLKNRRGNAKLHYFDFVTTGGKKFVTTSTSDHPARVLPRPDA